MQAVILCAGMGTRLHPYTQDAPKCLVEVCGKAILSYQIEALRFCGIQDITIVTGYMHEKIVHYFKGKTLKVNIIRNRIYERTNSLYSLYLAKHTMINTDFVLINGDIIFDHQLLMKLIKVETNMSATLVDAKAILLDGEMNVRIEMGLIKEFSKEIPKEQANALSLQITKFSSEDSKLLFKRTEEIINTEEKKYAFPAKAYEPVIKKSKMIPVYRDDEVWAEIDEAKDIVRITKVLEKNESKNR